MVVGVGVGKRLIVKRYKWNFGYDGNVLYYYYSGGYLFVVFICENLYI